MEGKALTKSVKIMCLSYWSPYFWYWSTVKSIVLQKHIYNLVKQFSTVYSISKNAASHIFNSLNTKPTKWVLNTPLHSVLCHKNNQSTTNELEAHIQQFFNKAIISITIRSSQFEVFLGKIVLEICSKFTHDEVQFQ